MITEWKKCKIGDCVINFDKKRIPLSSREREKRQGKYPYYGATGILDCVDEYIFDGKYILLGEDGTVVDANGFPVLQVVSGKFWVNNHAHVLQNDLSVDFDFLFYKLKSTNVSSIVTGAVQPKISQSRLNSLEITLPLLPTQKKIAAVLSALDAKIENNNAINRNLEQQAQALFDNMVDGKEKCGTVGDYCVVKSGFAFKSSWWTQKGIKVIKIANIGVGRIDWSTCSFVSEDKFRNCHICIVC